MTTRTSSWSSLISLWTSGSGQWSGCDPPGRWSSGQHRFPSCKDLWTPLSAPPAGLLLTPGRSASGGFLCDAADWLLSNLGQPEEEEVSLHSDNPWSSSLPLSLLQPWSSNVDHLSDPEISMAEDDSSQLGEIRSPPLQSAAHSIIYGLGGGGRVQLLPQSHVWKSLLTLDLALPASASRAVSSIMSEFFWKQKYLSSWCLVVWSVKRVENAGIILGVGVLVPINMALVGDIGARGNAGSWRLLLVVERNWECNWADFQPSSQQPGRRSN